MAEEGEEVGAAGDALTVKVPAEVPVPPAVMTDTVPVVPEPITATMVVSLKEVIDETAVPPIRVLGAVIPVKPVPLIVIVVLPAHPEAGVKLVTVGATGGENL